MGEVAEATSLTDAEPDGMLAYALAMENPDRNDPNWPLPSFDARDWAEAFADICKRQGVGADIGTDWMHAWFANALMRGWDEHARRTSGLVEALREIADPIPAMQRRAEEEGNQLNGLAITIANDPAHLKRIAREALAKLDDANG
jgi:hypothetical protein